MSISVFFDGSGGSIYFFGHRHRFRVQRHSYLEPYLSFSNAFVNSFSNWFSNRRESGKFMWKVILGYLVIPLVGDVGCRIGYVKWGVPPPNYLVIFQMILMLPLNLVLIIYVATKLL